MNNNLKRLIELQKIDSRLLNIEELRGDLPIRVEKLTNDLSIILEHVQALSSLELDTNIEDVFIHPLEKELKLVEDIEIDSLTHDEALSNAPESKDGKFVVPPSME